MKRLKVHVVYMGPTSDAVGSNEEFILLPSPAFLHDLINEVLRNHEDLKKIRSTLKISVNREIARHNVELFHGDEIAIHPPAE